MNDLSIGIIGTGIMGEPMARNLLRAGYRVAVHNRTKSKADALITAGARWHGSPASLAAACDIVISIVSDSPDVESVYLGNDGVVGAVHDGLICVDMSTVAPDLERRIADEVRRKGGDFLDAPVSGGKTGADAGTLAIMVGGEESTLAKVRPVFSAIGKSIVHCGPVGHGQLAKLCNQILCGLNLLAVSEAIVFAKRAGLDPTTMLAAVSKGAAGSWAVDNLGPRMLQRDFRPMFMVDLQQKDLRIVLSAARDSSLPLPGTALVNQLLAANQAAGEGREGTQALVKTLERLSGMNQS